MLSVGPQDRGEFGDILAGFSNVRTISRGTGQRVVLRAEHPALGVVAVKLATRCPDALIERFRREVGVLREISSKYYPKQYEFYVTPAGGVCTVEQYIEGEDLAGCMGRFADPAAARALVADLCEGLAELWRRNVVHRDVKPGNVRIAAGSEPRIIDLGIARFLNEPSLTHESALRGPCTPNYAAPEQLANRKVDIDWRTDQFALGLLFAQLVLGGRHPFDPLLVGGGATIQENIAAGRWDGNGVRASAGATAAGVIAQMLGVQPYMRYRTPSALLADLRS